MPRSEDKAIVPATAGFFLVGRDIEDDDGEIDIKFTLYPIIAWHIVMDGEIVETTPIMALNGMTELPWWESQSVLYPNGEIIAGEGTGDRFKDLGKYREHLLERHALEAREAEAAE
jgi:hypothetical protein